MANVEVHFTNGGILRLEHVRNIHDRSPLLCFECEGEVVSAPMCNVQYIIDREAEFRVDLKDEEHHTLEIVLEYVDGDVKIDLNGTTYTIPGGETCGEKDLAWLCNGAGLAISEAHTLLLYLIEQARTHGNHVAYFEVMDGQWKEI